MPPELPPKCFREIDDDYFSMRVCGRSLLPDGVVEGQFADADEDLSTPLDLKMGHLFI